MLKKLTLTLILTLSAIVGATLLLKPSECMGANCPVNAICRTSYDCGYSCSLECRTISLAHYERRCVLTLPPQ